MLLSHSVVLEINMKKILWLSTAFGSSYVMLGCFDGVENERLVHLDGQSMLIKQYQMEATANICAMSCEWQVLVPLVELNCVEVINLKQRSVKRLQYNFWMKTFDYLQMFVFIDSQMMCFKQFKSHDKSQLRLCYFKSPLSASDKKLIEGEFEIKKSQNFRVVSKVNEQSMVSSFTYKNVDWLQIDFYAVQLLEGKAKWRLKSVKLFLRVILPSLFSADCKECVLSIVYLWQIRKGQMLIVSFPLRDHLQIEDDFNKLNYIVLNVQQEAVRHVRLELPYGVSWMNKTIFVLGSFTVIYSIQKTKYIFGLQRAERVYFNNEKEKKQIIQSIKFDVFGDRGRCDYNERILEYGSQSKLSRMEVTVTEIGILNMKNVFLQMLLHLNEDFDDDLLSDAIDLLD